MTQSLGTRCSPNMWGYLTILDVLWFFPLAMLVYAHFELPEQIFERRWSYAAFTLAFISIGYVLLILLWPIIFQLRPLVNGPPTDKHRLWVGIILAPAMCAYLLVTGRHLIHYVWQRKLVELYVSLTSIAVSVGFLGWWLWPVVP